jgi:PadR family transcriptional regulator, regulatory protein PadR
MHPSGDPARAGILPGTLELIVLRTLTTMGPRHAYGIAARVEQRSAELVNRLLTDEALG